jgi:hypothetical protein
MSLKIVDAGLQRKLTDLASAWNSTKLKLHLYKNNVTPTTSSTVGSFTESTFTGYAAQDISGWAYDTVASHVADMVASSNTFTRTSTGAGESVYGYFVTDQAGTTLYFAELDPNGPRTLTNSGDSYTVTPKMTDQDLST